MFHSPLKSSSSSNSLTCWAEHNRGEHEGLASIFALLTITWYLRRNDHYHPLSAPQLWFSNPTFHPMVHLQKVTVDTTVDVRPEIADPIRPEIAVRSSRLALRRAQVDLPVEHRRRLRSPTRNAPGRSTGGPSAWRVARCGKGGPMKGGLADIEDSPFRCFGSHGSMRPARSSMVEGG